MGFCENVYLWGRIIKISAKYGSWERPCLQLFILQRWVNYYFYIYHKACFHMTSFFSLSGRNLVKNLVTGFAFSRPSLGFFLMGNCKSWSESVLLICSFPVFKWSSLQKLMVAMFELFFVKITVLLFLTYFHIFDSRRPRVLWLFANKMNPNRNTFPSGLGWIPAATTKENPGFDQVWIFTLFLRLPLLNCLYVLVF